MYIRQFEIENYRSLKKVKVGSLSNFVVFYGNNDCGKSNILSFIELVFKKKRLKDVTELADTVHGALLSPQTERFGWFGRGEIDGFYDNFYNDCKEPIRFKFLIRYSKKEIFKNLALPKEFLKKIDSKRLLHNLEIKGQIKKLMDKDSAEIEVTTVDFNSVSFYDVALKPEARFLPDFKLKDEISPEVFNKIMSSLNDMFVTVNNNRFLTKETEHARDTKTSLTPNSFKNWLFKISTGRDTEALFRKICDEFNSAPFNFGRLSLARVGEKGIDIFVEDKTGQKRPIGHKGTGVQQILMILTYIAESNSPLVGIEEIEINLSPQSQKAIFNILLKLVKQSDGPINQVFLSTHSPHIGRRNEASRRAVSLDTDNGTKVAKPTEIKTTSFFSFR